MHEDGEEIFAFVFFFLRELFTAPSSIRAKTLDEKVVRVETQVATYFSLSSVVILGLNSDTKECCV
jgi:hypothetical protein